MSNKKKKESQKSNQICHANEALKPGIILDIETVELNTIGPGKRIGLKKVLNLVIINIKSKHLVRCFSHKLLTEVRTNEPTSANHANSDWLNGVAV